MKKLKKMNQKSIMILGVINRLLLKTMKLKKMKNKVKNSNKRRKIVILLTKKKKLLILRKIIFFQIIFIYKFINKILKNLKIIIKVKNMKK